MSRLVIKPTKWHVHPANTQISLGIHPVWSESLLPACRKLGSWATIKRTAKTLIRPGRCPGWSVFTGRTVILLVLSCHSSNAKNIDCIKYMYMQFCYEKWLSAEKKVNCVCLLKVYVCQCILECDWILFICLHWGSPSLVMCKISLFLYLKTRQLIMYIFVRNTHILYLSCHSVLCIQVHKPTLNCDFCYRG